VKVPQNVSEGLLLKKTQPVYPIQAKQARVAGKVQLQADIGKDGSVTQVKALSGDDALSRAAMDAVRHWKYKPYSVNGQAVEMETQVTVDFKLPE
jgi:periplasmic protein TonB